jgi:hypothetical protein
VHSDGIAVKFKGDCTASGAGAFPYASGHRAANGDYL